MFNLKSTKFIPDRENWSNIGTNLLRVKNPFKNCHEYTEVVFDDLICSVLSLGIHSSLVSIDFIKIPKEMSIKEPNKKLREIYES